MGSTSQANPFDTVNRDDDSPEDVDRPDLKAPPPSPEPDACEVERGMDRWESVKPY